MITQHDASQTIDGKDGSQEFQSILKNSIASMFVRLTGEGVESTEQVPANAALDGMQDLDCGGTDAGLAG